MSLALWACPTETGVGRISITWVTYSNDNIPILVSISVYILSMTFEPKTWKVHFVLVVQHLKCYDGNDAERGHGDCHSCLIYWYSLGFIIQKVEPMQENVEVLIASAMLRTQQNK